MNRVDWDHYFMEIARVVASRATCDRKHVGAVIVRDRVILSTGYNGSVKGMAHCSDVGHMMEDGHCVRTVHSEANAIIQAAKNGVAIDGGTIYCTASPCWPCFKLIANAGLKKIIFGEMYRDDRITQFAKEAGIALVDLSVPKPSVEERMSRFAKDAGMSDFNLWLQPDQCVRCSSSAAMISIVDTLTNTMIYKCAACGHEHKKE